MEPLFELTPNVSADYPTPDPELPRGWSTHLTQVVARQVRRWREARGYSAQQLSDRTRQLGHRVPRTVITNLENDRRDTLTVAELLILAAALDVPPALLISAVGYEPSIKILPGVEETTWRARGWLLGALAPNYGTFSPKAWEQGRRAIELYDMHRLLVNECRQTLRRIRRLAGDRGLDVTDFPFLEGTTKLQYTTLVEVVTELSYSLDQLRMHRRHIQSEGFQLPEVPSALAAMLREPSSGGRHHRPEETAGGVSGVQENLLPPLIHDLMLAMRDETRADPSSSE